jgi:hypothetical protein
MNYSNCGLGRVCCIDEIRFCRSEDIQRFNFDAVHSNGFQEIYLIPLNSLVPIPINAELAAVTGIDFCESEVSNTVTPMRSRAVQCSDIQRLDLIPVNAKGLLPVNAASVQAVALMRFDFQVNFQVSPCNRNVV